MIKNRFGLPVLQFQYGETINRDNKVVSKRKATYGKEGEIYITISSYRMNSSPSIVALASLSSAQKLLCNLSRLERGSKEAYLKKSTEEEDQVHSMLVLMIG